MSHECEKCNKKFKYEYLLQKHLNRKIKCISNDILLDKYIEDIINIEDKVNENIKLSFESKIKCYFCEKIFSKKGNLERHINITCKNKKELVNNKEIINLKKIKLENDINKNINSKKNITKKEEHINKLENEIDILKKTLNTILKKQHVKNSSDEKNNITFQQVINNVNINNNLMINLNSFGKENINHITEKDYKQYMSGFFPGFIKFIKKIHFDDDMPENHNIYATNLKSKYIYVYEDNKWIIKQKNDIIDDIMRKKYLLLDDKCEEYEDKEINENISSKFREFQKNFYNDEAQKNTKDDIMLLLYNNRDKIKKPQNNILQ